MTPEYSFRQWVTDLALWIPISEYNTQQQLSAIILNLDGHAKDVAKTLSAQEMRHGGIVNGQQVDPVALLLHTLHLRFGPDEEAQET